MPGRRLVDDLLEAAGLLPDVFVPGSFWASILCLLRDPVYGASSGHRWFRTVNRHVVRHTHWEVELNMFEDAYCLCCGAERSVYVRNLEKYSYRSRRTAPRPAWSQQHHGYYQIHGLDGEWIS